MMISEIFEKGRFIMPFISYSKYSPLKNICSLTLGNFVWTEFAQFISLWEGFMLKGWLWLWPRIVHPLLNKYPCPASAFLMWLVEMILLPLLFNPMKVCDHSTFVLVVKNSNKSIDVMSSFTNTCQKSISSH